MNGFSCRRALGLAVAALALAPAHAMAAIDLSNYVRVGRYDLPEPTRTTAPAGNLLAQEASASRTTGTPTRCSWSATAARRSPRSRRPGSSINSMTLAPAQPAGHEFYDTEGITYVGGGKFVMTEERDRQLVQFTYAAGTTLTRAATQTVKLGTTIGNIGLEGRHLRPADRRLHRRQGDGAAIGSSRPASTSPPAPRPTARRRPTKSINLFDPALVGLVGLLRRLRALEPAAAERRGRTSHLLIISQESGKDRQGRPRRASLRHADDRADPGNPLSVPDQAHRGRHDGRRRQHLLVSEKGGGDNDHPQLWVYAPSSRRRTSRRPRCRSPTR